ncbi:MAG: DnaJ domain-containing protein [Chlorobi bacterium]|nr:DnaJ domain-containing protein [Chlorobiota bacterium]
MGIFERIARILRAEFNDRTSRASEPLDADDDELRRIIEELDSPRPQQSPPPRTMGIVEWAYRTLGVTPSASNDEIKAAYRRAIGKVHPDRFARAPEHEQRQAARRAQEINRAYAILKAVRKF